MPPRTKASLIPLFLVSLASVGFEIFLTRYFAIANWSEYGYWVISIAMVGLSASGVFLSLFKEFFEGQAKRLLFLIPLLLMVFTCLGFYLVTINPFNPLELQNRDLWLAQLLNIGKYYAALFPFYFITGLYIGLYFLMFQQEIPKVYGADLAGAGAGALAILFLMFWVHPFYLLAFLLPFLFLACILYLPEGMKTRGYPVYAALVIIFVSSEFFIIRFNRADFNEYKGIYQALHVKDSKVIEEIRSPRGYFMVLDNFTERLDTDFSNNFSTLGAAEPPVTYGLYKNGNRITSLSKGLDFDQSYVRAALDSFPYKLINSPRVLLIGTRGGFRIREALSLGASSILALEPDDTILELIKNGVKGHGDPLLKDPRVAISHQSPAMVFAAKGEGFDIIDISSDFLDQAEVNKYAFTLEAVQGYFRILRDNGLVSIAVPIREFTVYAVKLLETVRRALSGLGINRPEGHIMVYRSSWNARVLISKRPFTQAQVRALKDFSDQRSFDTSFFPGIDPAEIQVWNDLPLVSFERETIESSPDGASDALMEESERLFSKDGPSFIRGHFFNLEPSTYDRPFFYSILRLTEIKRILNKISLIPREEIGYLVNLAVLLQALFFALIVLSLPWVRLRGRRQGLDIILKSILYFAWLGIGFLFLEILIIEKASLFLNDYTYSFALVLSGMLVFSGMGSYASTAYLRTPKKGVILASVIVSIWIVLALFFLDRLLFSLLWLPFAIKCLVVLGAIAPLSFALGFPFPLGLSLFQGERSAFLPWAWALNGAFSVISTPLANLLAVSFGYRTIFWLSLLIYGTIHLVFPDFKD